MSEPVEQAAAIPVRGGLVCLVTTRSGRRWVVPKGRIEPDQTPARAAAAEAWEEAGLVGTVRPDPVGVYEYGKNGRAHRVTVFVLDVAVEHDRWPERDRRTRAWVPPGDAVRRVRGKGLRAVLKAALVED